MKIDLTGKTAIVSGSTAGIGFAIAKGLAESGAHVVINGRTEERVKSALATIRAAHHHAKLTGVAADLGTAEGAATLITKVPEADILVNNLGIFEPKKFFDIPDEDWERFFRVNVLSGVRLARHYAPGMVKKGWGRVLFISSESGLQIPAEMVHYGTTKTAQLAVARGLAETLAGTGVTVNSVLPGPTRSEGVEKFIEQAGRATGKTAAEMEKDFFRSMRPSSLIKRFATNEEVANMVVYLSSEQASATTGSSVRVDGGVVRSIA
jgi:NAD(P)-dependent dehydrogenase (short-subunit alcohol dehydrogenase family)